jgi:hypothetical protein
MQLQQCYVILATWFYNIIFKIKYKSYVASEWTPPPPNKNSGSAPAAHSSMIVIVIEAFKLKVVC